MEAGAINSSYINAYTDVAKQNLNFENFRKSSENFASQNYGARSSELKNMDELAQEFEAQFISQMFKTMFNTVEVNKEFGGGFAEETFREFLVDEYGKIISKSGGIGITDEIKQSFINMQSND